MGIESTSNPLRYGYHLLYPQTSSYIISTQLTSLGAGGPQINELPNAAAFELAGYRLDAADEVYWAVPVEEFLKDMDLASDIQARVLFTSTRAAPTTGVIFRLDAKVFADQVVLSDTKVSPTGARVFPAKGVTLDDGVTVTDWGPLQMKNTIRGPELSTPTVMLGFALTLQSLGDAAADDIGLFAVALRFTKEIMTGTGARDIT